MLTLLKIRMTYMKRNICNSFCTYLIFPLLFIFYGPFLEMIMEKKIKGVANISNNLKIFNDSIPNHPYSYIVNYNLFSKKLNLNNETLAIITNDSIGKDMEKVLKNIKNLNISLFNSTKEFNDEINSKNYKDKNSYTLFLEIEKKDKEYEFKFKVDKIQTTSLQSSSNEFNIDSRTNVKQKAQKKITQFKKIHEIITYYFAYLNNNVTKTFTIESTQFINGEEIQQPQIDFLNLDFDFAYLSIFFLF